MAVVIVATPGASNANSYLTLAEAETYFESRLHTADWDGATTDNKNRGLVMATRLLDRHFDWVSIPTTDEQALQWPREGILDSNERTTIDNDVIPDELKWATAEFAMQLITEDRSLDSDIETQGLTGLKAGPIALQFKESVFSKPVPDAVVSLIPEWWGELKGSSRSIELVRA